MRQLKENATIQSVTPMSSILGTFWVKPYAAEPNVRRFLFETQKPCLAYQEWRTQLIFALQRIRKKQEENYGCFTKNFERKRVHKNPLSVGEHACLRGGQKVSKDSQNHIQQEEQSFVKCLGCNIATHQVDASLQQLELFI